MTEPGLNVLLVEDSSADLELTVHALRGEGLAHEIDVARDGEEALDYLFCRNAHDDRSFEDAPRLVLLDLKLPKVHGLEVLRQLKEDPRTRAIPVVILTASREEDDRTRAYRQGANGYVQKPVDFEAFRAVMRHVGLYWLVVNQPAPAAAFREPAAAPVANGAQDREVGEIQQTPPLELMPGGDLRAG